MKFLFKIRVLLLLLVLGYQAGAQSVDTYDLSPFTIAPITSGQTQGIYFNATLQGGNSLVNQEISFTIISSQRISLTEASTPSSNVLIHTITPDPSDIYHKFTYRLKFAEFEKNEVLSLNYTLYYCNSMSNDVVTFTTTTTNANTLIKTPVLEIPVLKFDPNIGVYSGTTEILSPCSSMFSFYSPSSLFYNAANLKIETTVTLNPSSSAPNYTLSDIQNKDHYDPYEYFTLTKNTASANVTSVRAERKVLIKEGTSFVYLDGCTAFKDITDGIPVVNNCTGGEIITSFLADNPKPFYQGSCKRGRAYLVINGNNLDQKSIVITAPANVKLIDPSNGTEKDQITILVDAPGLVSVGYSIYYEIKSNNLATNVLKLSGTFDGGSPFSSDLIANDILNLPACDDYAYTSLYGYGDYQIVGDNTTNSNRILAFTNSEGTLSSIKYAFKFSDGTYSVSIPNAAIPPLFFYGNSSPAIGQFIPMSDLKDTYGSVLFPNTQYIPNATTNSFEIKGIALAPDCGNSLYVYFPNCPLNPDLLNGTFYHSSINYVNFNYYGHPGYFSVQKSSSVRPISQIDCSINSSVSLVRLEASATNNTLNLQLQSGQNYYQVYSLQNTSGRIINNVILTETITSPMGSGERNVFKAFNNGSLFTSFTMSSNGNVYTYTFTNLQLGPNKTLKIAFKRNFAGALSYSATIKANELGFDINTINTNLSVGPNNACCSSAQYPVTVTGVTTDIVCNSTMSLYAYSIDDASITYAWQSPSGVQLSAEQGLVIPHMQNVNAGTYKFILTPFAGCSLPTDVPVTVKCQPVFPCSECVPSFSPFPGQKYVLSGWVKEEHPANAMPPGFVNVGIRISYNESVYLPYTARPSGPVIDGWQRIEYAFVIPSDATSIELALLNENAQVDAYFDDVRVHPFLSNAKSFVYDPSTQRLVAELDENNYATKYEYDDEGILIRVKKETERGVMTIKESRSNQSKLNK